MSSGLFVLLFVGGYALSPKFSALRSPRGGTTTVSWRMNGEMGGNPLFRWIALFMDRMVGPDFEAGLANLKALAEKP